MSAIDRPHGTTLAALKGLAIATSLLTAGQLGTVTLYLPSIYPAALTSHRLAAQQFAHQYRIGKATGPPAEILTTLICSGLAYVGYSNNKGGVSWKLWVAAAGCMAAVIPWTITLMEKPSRKLLWVSEVADSATKPQMPSSGVGVKVSPASPTPEQQSFSLGLPQGGQPSNSGIITPMEEFEPFEDAIVGDEYEQLKVIKLLKMYNSYNTVRTLGPLAAGILGLWAVLAE